MYEYIKLAAAFTIGVGAGILASKRFFQTKYEKIANEEIESIRRSAEKRSHILEESSIDDPEKFANKLIEEVKNNDIRSTHVYSTIDNMYQKPTAERILEKEHPEDDRPEDCYEITEAEYSETALGYDKRTLHYYIEDDMLVDADNGDWTNNDLGSETYERIRTTDEKALYFRNDPSAIDYEVIIMEGAYYISM